jgi:hypothetical protein
LHRASKQLSHPPPDAISVDEGIGVVFKPIPAFKDGSRCATVRALIIIPSVLHALKPDVSRIMGEGLGNGMITLGMLGAIHATSREKACELRDADPKHLTGQDVIHTIFKIWYFLS